MARALAGGLFLPIPRPTFPPVSDPLPGAVQSVPGEDDRLQALFTSAHAFSVGFHS